MNFLFWLSNHSPEGIRTLEDPINIISHQLRALGHKAIYNPNNNELLPKEAGYNIVVEGFTPGLYEIEGEGGSIGAMAKGYTSGARFIILATEEPTDRGFNYGTEFAFVKRQEMFPHAAKYADGIIHLVPGDHVTKWYSQFAPSAYSELGYASTLIRDFDFEPEWDFGFFGLLSQRRHQILKRLAKRIRTQKAVRISASFTDQADRDHQMREAKVIIQIRKNDKMGLVSSSRCNTALCIGRSVLAEPHDLSYPWDEIIQFSSSLESFYDQALIMRASWKGVHVNQLEKFKDKLSPEKCIGKALREIGICQ